MRKNFVVNVSKEFNQDMIKEAITQYIEASNESGNSKAEPIIDKDVNISEKSV